MTSIGDNAFYKCSGLASITISEGVTSIGRYAFSWCSGLTSITIPESVTSIGDDAFSYCSSLTSINIPEGVTSIGSDAFLGCRNLTSVILNSDSIVSKSYTMSSGINNIFGRQVKEYVLGESVTSIGNSAFGDCYNLISVTIPESVTSIGNNAFRGCGSLTSITIPESVTSIGDHAFFSCSGLTSITIPAGVTTIGDHAFTYCGLISITVAASNSFYDSRYNCNAIIQTSTNTLIVGCKNTIIPSDIVSIGDFAFWGCSGLTSITISESVKSIDRSAFDYCSGLTSITVAASNPFYDSRNNCNAIIQKSTNTLIAGCKNTIIPSDIVSIGNSAFYGCSGLTSITIPEGVMSIGDHAFYDCSGLTSITIPDGVATIGNYAFYGTAWYEDQPDGLIYAGKVAYKYKGTMPENTNIELKEDTKGIAGSAFNRCSGLTSITLPEGVTTIGNSAFFSCRSLSSVSIPESVTNIGSSAFADCRGLNSITIPEGVTSIGSNAFQGCSSLTSITLPEGVTTIGNMAFFGCSTLSFVSIPESVTNIESSAFAYCRGLTSITIPESVEFIYDNFLYYCDSLTSVTIMNKKPISVTKTTLTDLLYINIRNTTLYVPVGCKAAYEAAEYWKEFKEIVELKPKDIDFVDAEVKRLCVANWDTDGDGELSYDEAAAVTSLKDVFKGNQIIRSFEELQYFKGLVNNNEKSLTDYAFKDCIGLTSITMPKNITNIGNFAFYGCTGLASITIPDSVTSIDPFVFYNCSGLTSITIPEGVTSIGDYTFYGCSGLTSITLPEGVTSIGNFAFQRCGLTSITLPRGVTTIGNCAFYECSTLSSVSIPENVTNIESTAFARCSGLTSITVAASNSFYDSRKNCNAIIQTSTNTLIAGCKNTIIPSDIVSIGNSAFDRCSGLTSINIPESVTSIGDYAFSACSGLTSITIPSSVSSIGYSAFSWCSNLTSVNIDKDTPISISESTFTNRANATLYVPFGSKAAYEAADYWKEFKEIIEDTSEIIDFADSRVKQLCVAQWDTDGDGELSYNEAAAVTSIKNVFTNKPEIQTFDELENFTGLTSINLMAFSSCSNLTSIRIPENVTNIALSAFSGCTKLASVIIPENVTKLGSAVFNQCLSLTSIIIPKNVQSIGSEPFAGCSNLVSIVIDEGNTVYDSRGNCNAIIKTGSNELIVGCKNTVIPNSVTSIASGTFSGCTELASIIIPGSVTNISAKAFESCDALTSVTVNAVMPPTIAATTFSNAANATLFVPYDSKEDYTAAAYWQDFQKIRSLDTDLIIIGTTGYATYCSENPLDFNEVTGMKAYIASYFKPSAGNLLLTRVTETQASEGLCIVGEPGEHEVRWSETDMTYSNLLKGVTTATTLSPTEDGNTNFILANGAHGVGFYPLSNASTLAAGKAYLQLPTAMIYGVKAVGLSFDDVETDIEELTDQLTNAIMYNLQGQRVFNPGRGIYIVNGKKVCIK